MASPHTKILLIVVYHAAIGEPRLPVRPASELHTPVAALCCIRARPDITTTAVNQPLSRSVGRAVQRSSSLAVPRFQFSEGQIFETMMKYH